MVRSLKWGETPFDRMSREELLRHAQRLYAAAESMESELEAHQYGREESPYWAEGGAGWNALTQGSQAVAAASEGFDREEIYRMFFRYARDLLFDGVGNRWRICPKCRVMAGRAWNGDSLTGAPCVSPKCDGVLRKITWEDLK